MDAMLRSGPASLFMEWRAFAMIEPFGEWRADLRIAQLDALFFNANKARTERPRKWSDFMPDFERPEKPKETPEAKVERLKAAGRLIAQAVGVIWTSGKKKEGSA